MEKDSREGFLKTTGAGAPDTPLAAVSGDSKARRVAKFLIMIGSEQASKILSHLDSAQVDEISREIAGIKGIGAAEGQAVMEEFRSLLQAPYGFSGGASGGVEAARRLLYAAYGPEKGESVLERALPSEKANPFGFLEDFSAQELSLLFREESPQAAAMVFSRLTPRLAAGAIACFTGEKKLEIVRRIARQEPVPPEVLAQVAGALREKARHIGKSDAENFDGMSALAAILKSSDAGFGDSILSDLESSDPDLGRSLKEKIYTLDDVVRAADLPLQKKLASMDNRDIVLLLKGRSEEFRKKISDNLSAVRREEIMEEDEILGPVPKSKTEEVASAFLAWFRQSREKGEILLLDDEDVFI